MKKMVKVFLLTIFCLCLLRSFVLAEDLKYTKLSENDYNDLKICEGVIQLFKQFPDSVWPGYDLAQRPFIVYVPDLWVLLFNYPKKTEDFTSYPADWPDLGTRVLFHPGQYRDLAGQLVFDFPVDSTKVAAIPLTGKSDVELFAFVVHEAFHQFQGSEFGEIPWEREEKYPIQDSRNTALAYLEMWLLMDALRASEKNQIKKCRELVRQFVAVRSLRWQSSEPFVAKYEQGQEINEGTAKYTELRSIALFKELEYRSSLSGHTKPLFEDFSAISMPGYLLEDFQARITDSSVSPEDMPRNRIYPVGAAQGFLLDYFRISWKKKAQEAGEKFSFAQLFGEYLNVKKSQVEKLVKKAQKEYGFSWSLFSAEKLIREYLDSFNRELDTFEAQPGYRIEIELNTNSLSRSRSSFARSWVVDQGTRELCSHYNIYVLKNKFLSLQLHDIGVYEQNDWNAGVRKVAFFEKGFGPITLDGQPATLTPGAEIRFKKMEVNGDGWKFTCEIEGTVLISGHRVRISLLK
ncbi:MAG TPA: hypothetical protein VMT04_10035 [Terriglobales bacterium]|nr:hypothetical protein [Terriglobales bacterium]